MFDNLKDWALNYFKFKSQFNNISIKEEKKDSIILLRNNNIEEWFINNYLSNINNELLKNNSFFITLNKKENIDFLINKWDLFLKNKSIILFAVPEKNLFWHLNVYHHDLITDKNNLKKSLYALYQNIS